jgi:DNA (cytosine-5)-methyltransferase 1
MRKGKAYSYIVAYKLFNSADFSVAQSRERLIYIAIRNDIVEERGITPQQIFDEIKAANSGNIRFLLRDALEAIKPLDAPRVKNTNEVDDEKTGKKIDYNAYNGNENEYLRLINGGRKISVVYNHKARYVNDVNYDIYRLLEQGDDASDPKIADILPYTNRLHCFKDKYYKLIADKPSRTITAHLRMDCHSHIHPYQIRSLTPREAARAQSFPDDYMFLGAYLKTYMQIGNAVPTLMANGIAKVIKKYLK